MVASDGGRDFEAPPKPAATRVELPLKPPIVVKPRPRLVREGQRQGDRSRDVVANLASQRGVLGAILARRDGFPLVAKWHEPVDIETFCAMHAAALNAAELALGSGRHARLGLMVDQGDRRILSRAVGRDLLFVLALKGGADWEAAFLWLEAAGIDVEE